MAVLCATALAGCSGDPVHTGSIGPMVPQSIAFESIDGPPRPVFDRLVAALSAEAEQRQLPVVSRSGPSVYRVRGYLATYVEAKKKQALLTWALDVFDTRTQRVFRVGGEEPLGPARKDVWAQCDEALLARVAARSFDALSAQVGPFTPTPSGAPATAGADIAITDRAGPLSFQAE